MASEAMQDVVEVIGLDLALVLAARKAGRTFHIPESAQNDKFLHLIIGPEAAGSLIFQLGGMDIELPALKDLDLHRRNERVCQLAASGVPPHDIGEVVGISTRQVRRIMSAEQELVNAYRQASEGRKATGA